MKNFLDDDFNCAFLIGFIIVFVTFILNGCEVKAANIDLSNPSRTCSDSTDGNTICNKAITATYWDNSYFSNDGYIGDPGSSSPIYKSINFQWDDINLCKGKSILISGYVAGLFDFFNNSYSVDVYNNDSKLSCSYSLENSSRLKYTCSGVGGGKFQINVNQFEFPVRGVYTIGVSKVVDISCDSSNADIITNNNNNSNANKINDSINNTNDTIKNDDVSGAESAADDLKNNEAFQDTSGLSSIISMPLTFVNSLTNKCEPIKLTIPYMDADVSIPCMQSIITSNMPLLANLIKIVVNGFIVYKILLDIFAIVRSARNPEDDRIEVLDL